MENEKIIFELDNILLDMEVALEKGKYQCDELCEKLSNKRTDSQKIYDWDRIRIMSEIAFDYAIKVDEAMRKARLLLDGSFKSLRKEEGTLNHGSKD